MHVSRAEMASSAFGLLAMTASDLPRRPCKRVGHAVVAPKELAVGADEGGPTDPAALLGLGGRIAQPRLDLVGAGARERGLGGDAEALQQPAQDALLAD